jgi:5S rRNA maturation endonuclease (ribonuclease M5)
MRANKEKIIEELNKIMDKTVIVEGIKDKRALEHFGFQNIVILKKGIFETCEEISKNEKKVVILTDLDSEGKKLYSVIYENLTRSNVKVEPSFREFLFRETGLRQIEGLVKYVDRLDN